jgi:excisionase family DNA binding protein
MATTAVPARRLISLLEAADQVGVCTRTMRRYISEGRIKGYRVGPRLVKVAAADIDELMRPIPAAGR